MFRMRKLLPKALIALFGTWPQPCRSLRTISMRMTATMLTGVQNIRGQPTNS